MPNLKRNEDGAWRLSCLAVVAIVICFCGSIARGAASVGDIAPNFSVVNHATSQPLLLYTYQDKIIVLDFWAYWCGFCQDAAADIEPNVAQYYQKNGGNINGVPIQLISISVDQSDLAGENNFISTFGLQLVGDDTTGNTFADFASGGIPYLVVINGTTNSTNHKAWQVLYTTPGYDRTGITNAIDSVQTTAPSISIVSPVNGAIAAPPDVSLTASVVDQGKVIKRVEFYDSGVLISAVTNAPYTFTWNSAPLGARSVTAQAVYGANGRVASTPVEFTVGTPAPIQGTISRQGSNLVLSWSGSPGLFRVQAVTNLSSSLWQDISSPSTNTSLMISATNVALFYRVIGQ